MRILVDENFPSDFATLLAGHEVSTVHALGWAGVKNGELLKRAAGLCDVFLTLDTNLQYQQNIKLLSFGVVLVRSHSNRLADLAALVPRILTAIASAKAGQVTVADA